MRAAPAPTERGDPGPPFVHEAFFYTGDEDYLAGVVPFVEDGLASGEAVLVALPERRLDLLRPRFAGHDGGPLRFAAMEDVGRNPAWIIPAWTDFLAAHTAGGGAARGVGEQIWADRTAAELVECERDESLLNLAFGTTAGFTLLCPYDARALDRAVIAEARRNHPRLRGAGAARGLHAYRDDVPGWLDAPLPLVPAAAEHLVFDGPRLRTTRRAVADAAAAAGVAPGRIDELVLAVSEALTNSVRHGGGSGHLAHWSDADHFVCEVRDRGRITDPLAGRVRPRPGQPGDRGLWLLHQLCDLVQIRPRAHGQVVRLHVAT